MLQPLKAPLDLLFFSFRVYHNFRGLDSIFALALELLFERRVTPVKSWGDIDNTGSEPSLKTEAARVTSYLFFQRQAFTMFDILRWDSLSSSGV